MTPAEFRQAMERARSAIFASLMEDTGNEDLASQLVVSTIITFFVEFLGPNVSDIAEFVERVNALLKLHESRYRVVKLE